MTDLLGGPGTRSRTTPLALVLASLAAGCSSQPPDAPDPVRPVKTVVVSAGGEPHIRTFPGKAEAPKKVELAFQVSGLLVDFPVKEGQKIKKGDLVARLRQEDFEIRLKVVKSQLDKARANLQALRAGARPEERARLETQVRAALAQLVKSRSDYDRAAQLLRGNAIARADYDRHLAAYRKAREDHEAAERTLEQGLVAREEDVQAKEAAVRGLEAQVVEAKLHLDDATLRAPYDGVIAQRFVKANQTVKAKQPIVQFQDVEEIDVAVDVPEAIMAADLRAADVERIVAEFTAAPGIQFPVQIREVAQKADPVTQTFRVRVTMQSPTEVKILPGMSATVTLTYRRARVLGDRILVPSTAVFKESQGGQIVWVIGADDTARRRPVKLGEASGDRIEITEGLDPGDRIAVAGVTFLREGMKVRDLGDALGGGQL